MSILVFDIETGPRPWAELEPLYEPPPAMPPWDDGMAKYGAAKKPELRAQILGEQKAKYQAKLAEEAADRDAHRCEWASKAALSPLTGEVLAIGLRTADQTAIIGEDGETEAEILEAFWTIYRKYRASNGYLVGYNCVGFDVPFLVRRSWFRGVETPDSLFERGRYLCPTFVDLMLRWTAGTCDTFCKLDTLAKFFNIGGKPDDCDGAAFAGLWLSGEPEARATAAAYLTNDLDMTWRLAEKMGVAE